MYTIIFIIVTLLLIGSETFYCYVRVVPTEIVRSFFRRFFHSCCHAAIRTFNYYVCVSDSNAF